VGITEPYEPPAHPEVVVDTSKQSIDEAVEHILGQLVAQRLLDPDIAAMKTRPRVQARAILPAAPPPPKPLSKVKELRKPSKAQRRAPARKSAAARTARVRPRMAAGGKRKR